MSTALLSPQLTKCVASLCVPRLSADQVHVWQLDLDALAPLAEQAHALLSPQEKDQSAPLPWPERIRFLARRVCRRLLLGRYLGVAPDELHFLPGPHGKPALDRRWHATDLRFNSSSSHWAALLAVTRGREIGVDIEYVDPQTNGLEIARRFFPPALVQTLQHLPPAWQREGFFNGWTRMEAYLKATGVGLGGAVPPAVFAPTSAETVRWPQGNPAPSDRPALPIRASVSFCVRRDAAQDERWSLRNLAVAPGYRGALAVRAQAFPMPSTLAPA